jgi:hypothetical protein
VGRHDVARSFLRVSSVRRASFAANAASILSASTAINWFFNVTIWRAQAARSAVPAWRSSSAINLSRSATKSAAGHNARGSLPEGRPFGAVRTRLAVQGWPAGRLLPSARFGVPDNRSVIVPSWTTRLCERSSGITSSRRVVNLRMRGGVKTVSMANAKHSNCDIISASRYYHRKRRAILL